METAGLELADNYLQYGLATEGDQGFGDNLGKGRKPHSFAACQDNGAQIFLLLLAMIDHDAQTGGNFGRGVLVTLIGIMRSGKPGPGHGI